MISTDLRARKLSVPRRNYLTINHEVSGRLRAGSIGRSCVEGRCPAGLSSATVLGVCPWGPWMMRHDLASPLVPQALNVGRTAGEAHGAQGGSEAAWKCCGDRRSVAEGARLQRDGGYLRARGS